MTIKSFTLGFGLLFGLMTFLSCHNDDDKGPNSFSNSIEADRKYAAPLSAENPLNPYDSIGWKHNEILERYLELDSLPISLNEKMSLLKNLLDFPVSFTPYEPEMEEINEILNNPTSSIYDSISSNPLLSTTAKSILVDLFEWLEVSVLDEELDHHSILLNWEDEILQAPLNLQEQEIILSLTSLIRFAFKKRKDRDWEFNVTNFIGGYEGIWTSSEKALLYALTIGVSTSD
jgi:hypothetical protein